MFWRKKEEKRLPEEKLREVEEKIDQLNSSVSKKIDQLDRLSVAEYLVCMDDKWKVFKMSVLIGLGRGLGTALGATLVFAIVCGILYKIALSLSYLDLPVIGDLLQQLIEILEKKHRMGP